MLEQDNPDLVLFAQEVRNCAGATVALGLWSAKVSIIVPQILTRTTRIDESRANAHVSFTSRSLSNPRL
jgi:hypothetical protein